MSGPRRRRYLLDAGIALLLLVVASLTGQWGSHQVPVAGLLLAAGGCAAVVGRRRWPQSMFVISVGCAEGALAAWGSDAGILVLAAPLICLYAVAEHSGWQRGVLVGGIALLVIFALHATVQPAWASPQNVALLGFGGFAVAAGEATRNRRAYAVAMEQRARQAELTADQEAEQRVATDRLRIARDLHDVLGHQLALISVHAGAAADVLERKPTDARTSLRHIKDASRTALCELRDVVVLLRGLDDPPVPTTTATSLSRLEQLLTSFARSGLTVEADLKGQAPSLPEHIDLIAYRIVQESLTNVVKHAPGHSAHVQVTYGSEELIIEVVNDMPSKTGDPQPGHGVAGMRERVVSAGGRLDIGPHSTGGFRVSARLPVTGVAVSGVEL